MNSEQELRRRLFERLQGLRARRRASDLLHATVCWALGGGVLAVATAIVAAVARAEWSVAAIAWSPALIPLGAILGAVLVLLRRVDDLSVARTLDRAADSADRFASALQLLDHRQSARAGLVLEDALQRVDRTSARAAIPLRAPRALRWLPLPVVALVLLILLVPPPLRMARAAQEPEVSAQEWESMREYLREQLADLPPPETPEEGELADQLRRLADLMEKNPEKKDALAELAKLRDALERRQQQFGDRNLSLRSAALTMRSSATLGKFAQLLAAGDYEAAAAELERLAQELEDDELALDADEFEKAAQDLENLAKEMEKNDEMGQACRSAATAAGRMNRKELSQSLRKLSKSMCKNGKSLRQSDRLCRNRSLLDELARRLGNCKNGQCSGEGDGSNFTKNSNRKGGKNAGWGTAANWAGGKLSGEKSANAPEMDDPAEGAGEVSVLPTVSPDERAASGQDFKEMYTQMIRKAEADLELESVPAAMRDYLKRYFVSIHPTDAPSDGKAATPGN